MKSINLILLFFLLYSKVSIAQTDIKNFPFIFNSDIELKYKIDVVDKGFFAENGTDIEWDLSDSESPLFKEIKIYNIDNLNQKVKIIDEEAVKVFQNGKTSFNLTSYTNLQNNSINSTIEFNNSILFAYKNLIFGSKFKDNTDFDLTLTRDQLPAKIKNVLPKGIKNVKIIGEIVRDFHCDAEGKFIFKYYDIPVLRVKVSEYVKIRIYDMYSGAEIPFLSNSVLNSIYPNTGNNSYYLFFSNDAKYYFARARYSVTDKNYEIEYQIENIQNGDININIEKKDILIFPNPSYGATKVYFSNIKEEQYTIEIYNIIGKKIWSRPINVYDFSILKFDFSFLRKGTYLLSLKDKFGNLISTKKLVIINV